jgi:ketosteroid isomerase-like protein
MILLKKAGLLLTLALSLSMSISLAYADTEADIRNVLTDYHKALGSNNVPQIEQYVVVGETFGMVEGKHTNWGWVDYRDNHLSEELADLSKVAFTLDFKSLHVSGDMAYASFIFSMSPKANPSQNWGSGRATAVLIRGPKGWLIQHLHTS